MRSPLGLIEMNKRKLLLFVIILIFTASEKAYAQNEDSLSSANDTLLATYFYKTWRNYNLDLETRVNRIEQIVSYVKNPNLKYGAENFLFSLSGIDGFLGYEKVKLQTIRIIKTLLEKGADPNIACGIPNIPALFKAADVDIARVLLENGADPNFHSQFGWTMFHDYMTLERLKLAREFEFDFTYINEENGWTLLHWATTNTRTCWTEDLDFLVKQIPEYINKYDNEGYAPIHYYARENFNDFYSLIEVLLNHGADPQIKTLKDSYYMDEILIPKGSTAYEIILLVSNSYSNPMRETNPTARQKVLERLKN